MHDTPVKTAIIGCGNISPIYLQKTKLFPALDVVACADMIVERAQARATEFGIPRACSVEELLADPEIELVINLTIPGAHLAVGRSILESDKHLYSEKPLGISREEGRALLEFAASRNLLVGCAPDTVLGAGIQTCRKLIDDGAIGKPIGASAFMMCHGHESWHPDPEFYYKKGGGPVYDMGPYYLSALITLLGPVKRVTGSTAISFPERTITSQPKAGTKFPVDVPTHISAVLDFTQGAIASLVMSFDVWSHHLPRIEIYGSEGSLSVPDPNTFGGPVLLRKGGEKDWQEIALTHEYAENTRGLGVADMAHAIRTGKAHRASGDLAFHVLDIFDAVHEASRDGKHICLQNSCKQPEPMNTSIIKEAVS